MPKRATVSEVLLYTRLLDDPKYARCSCGHIARVPRGDVTHVCPACGRVAAWDALEECTEAEYRASRAAGGAATGGGPGGSHP